MSSQQPSGFTFKLSAPAQRALAAAGIQRIEDFSKWKEADLRELHGIGPNAIDTIKKNMKEKGILFAGK